MKKKWARSRVSVDSSVVVASGKLVPGGKELVGNELSSWPSHSVTPCNDGNKFESPMFCNSSFDASYFSGEQILSLMLWWGKNNSKGMEI